ncbi:Flp family type IVb pilin [Massilia sp. LXY-6]|uniref:Flp family type IVb pilin n=1 Tax=Massilia sp. LXY-6 TaxID=3379823 RepID=UPI003EE03B15
MDILNVSKNMIADFAREEDGAQIVEYGLIIAAVSLVLIGLLAQLGGTNGAFTTLKNNIGSWLASSAKPAG